MNRFTYAFGLRIDRAYLLVLAFAFLTVTIIADTQGDIHIVPLSEKFLIRRAYRLVDEAETTEIQDEDPKKMEKNRQQRQKLYDTALALYLEVIERDTKAEYAQRVHYQIAKIYKRRYDWDNATKHYQAIVALDPTGYYANEAKNGMANIRKNREIIKAKQTEYQNYKAIYDDSPTDETFNVAAEALYEVARAYESLENHPEAIRNYERLVEEFPEHPKAPQAQFQIGTLYFYVLYDYRGGWPAYKAVSEKFPDTYEASQAETLLKVTSEILSEINNLKAEIDKFRNKKAVEYQKTGQEITSDDMWMVGYSDQVVQNFQQIASNWEKLRNYPRAINAYKTLARDLYVQQIASNWEKLRNYPRAINTYETLARDLSDKKGDALLRTASLYQQNGEYERAIEVYNDLIETQPKSVWQNEAAYQRGICYRILSAEN